MNEKYNEKGEKDNLLKGTGRLLGLPTLNKVLICISVVFLVLQFFQLNQIVTRESAHYGIVFSKDGDSANSIKVLERTFWGGSNGWFPYGPLYYRVAHSVQKADVMTRGKEYRSSVAVRDRSFHYALLLTSLLSVIALCVFFGIWIGSSILQKTLVSSILIYSLFQSATWSEFILVAKPEIFLSFLVGVATFLTILWKTTLDKALKNKYFIVAAFVWGCALSTKMNTLTLLPGLGLVLLHPFKWRRLRAGLIDAVKFFSLLMLGYFFIGAPQNFEIIKVIQYLKYITVANLQLKASTESAGLILSEFADQFLIPALFIFILTVLYYDPRDKSRLKVSYLPWWSVLIPGFSLFYLLTKTSYGDQSHYVLPVTASALACVLFFSRFVGEKIWNRFQILYRSWTAPVFALAAIIGLVSFQLIPISVIEKFEVSNKCRDQAEIVSLEIGRMIKTGLAIIADPYVPHAPISSKKIRNVWGNKLTDLNGESSAFVTKRQFYGRYLGTIPSKYVLLDHSMEEWREINHFYKIIKNNETFVDLENRIWNLQLRTECGWEIWKRSKRFYEKCDQ